MMSVAVVGRGAIGGPIIAALAGGARPGVRLAGVLVPEVRADHETDSIDALLALRPDLVIEAAGHQAAQAVAEPVIASGVDLLLFSVGALAQREFEVLCRSATSRRSAGPRPQINHATTTSSAEKIRAVTTAAAPDTRKAEL